MVDRKDKNFRKGSKEQNERLRRVVRRILGKSLERISRGDGNNVRILKTQHQS